MNTFFILSIVGIIFMNAMVNAAQISASQIEKFKKLPKAQQKMLASSMGVDINQINAQIGSSDNNATETEELTQSMARENASTGYEKDSDEEAYLTDDSLKPFGYDVFANTPQSLAPTLDIAIPSGYMVGPGDKVTIQTYGKENNELELTINREGQLIFPNYGPVMVAGLSFIEMKNLLTSRIKSKVLGVDVVISMASLRSLRVFVLGDVFKPGTYNLSSLSSITHAIFAAGGISDVGSLRNIQLKRAGKLVQQVDLYELLIHGDSSSDVLLQSGDVIFVSSVGSTISIEGEVRRPAIYELKDNETLADVLVMSGGLLPSAYAKFSIVERYNTNHLRSVLNLDLTDKDELNTKASAGDYIRILKASDTFDASVTFIGAITRPGKYQWKPEQKISDILSGVNSHLLKSADLQYSIVVREKDQSRNIEIIQFSLANAINDNDSEDNVLLSPRDKVIVFSNINTIGDDIFDLDMFAFTKADLEKKEHQKLKDEFNKSAFQNKYDVSVFDEDGLIDTQEDEHKIKRSVVELLDEDNKDIDLSGLDHFSRQRLLLPIINKLKRQGGAGQPIQLVDVDGAVKFPGIYPLGKNSRVDDLIYAAGGLEESAYLAQAEITRNVVESKVANKVSIAVNLSSALSGSNDENILLKSKDRLNVHKIPAWSENHVVELRGEFVFPGKYTIRRGETLSTLIAKAGGFTEYSAPHSAVFTREKLKLIEQKNLIKLSDDLRLEIASKSLSADGYSQSYAEVQEMLSDLTQVTPVGRLVVDLPEVVKDNEYDILLESGDILYLPSKNNSINVIGQVQAPTSHVYRASLDGYDYIAQSGGGKKRADEDRIYILSANGSTKMLSDGWFTTPHLEPGDTIVVPLNSEYMNNLALWTSVTGIIYNSAVAIAAISGI